MKKLSLLFVLLLFSLILIGNSRALDEKVLPEEKIDVRELGEVLKIEEELELSPVIPENVDENGCYDYDYYGGCDEGKCILEIGSSKCTETIQDFLEKALYKMNHCILAHETSESVKIIDDVEYVIKFLDVQAPPPRVSFTLEYEGGSEYFTNKVGTEEETLEDGTKVIISEISLGENSATICIE